METKKNPEKNLESYSQLFWQLGLVISMFTVYLAIEYKTYYEEDTALAAIVSSRDIDTDAAIEIVIEQPEIEQPKPEVQQPDVLEVIDDDTDDPEDVFIPTDVDPDDKVVTKVFVHVETPDIIDDPTIPLILVEDAPIFPGCEKYAEKGLEAQKNCLNKSIDKHVQKKFNAGLANELGLTPGVKRILVQFKIKSDGTIEIMGVRAPHKRLEKEAERIVKLLPLMKPGMQQGRAVNVTYMKPIVFKVE